MSQQVPFTVHGLIELQRAQHRLFACLGAALAFSVGFHWWIGPDELQHSHMLLGRYLIFGQPVETPANPMWGYAIIITLLGTWTPLVNGIAGFASYVWAYREMNLDRAKPSTLTYIATLAYAAIAGSWHDTALWLSLVLVATALLYRYGVSAAVPGVAVGLSWGLAYNIRSEALLMCAAFLATSFAFHRLAHRKAPILHHAAAAAAFLATMVPWGIYTEATIGKYAPSSTNGGAVAYYSLGLVPDNGHDIHFKDEYVYEQAKLFGEASPWSSRSSDHFRSEYIRLIEQEPGLFARKVTWGVFTALRSGIYFFDLTRLIAKTPEDDAHLKAILIEIKEAIGLPQAFLRADRDLSPYKQFRSARPATMMEYIVIAANYGIGLAMKVAVGIALLQFSLMIFQPTAAMSWGPIAPVALSVILSTLALSALLIPSVRLNSVVFVFIALALQKRSCVTTAEHRSLSEIAASLDASGLLGRRPWRWPASPLTKPGIVSKRKGAFDAS